MPTVKDIIVKKPTEQEIRTATQWPIWSCETSTFDWDYTQSETCLILQGKVTVKDRPGSNSVTFGPGDMVIFPKDLPCIWQVTEPIKKHYIFD